MLQIVHLCIASLPNLERYGIPDEPELDRRRYEVKTLDLRSITELVAEIKTYCLPCERVDGDDHKSGKKGRSQPAGGLASVLHKLRPVLARMMSSLSNIPASLMAAKPFVANRALVLRGFAADDARSVFSAEHRVSSMCRGATLNADEGKNWLTDATNTEVTSGRLRSQSG